MTGYHPPYFYQQFFDTLGNPLANGKLYTYENMSVIPKPIFTDFDLLYPCSNPLELNVAGIAQQYFCTSGFYTFTLKDRFDQVIASRDFIEGSLGSNFQFDSADYVLSAATTTTLGGIKVGNGLAITSGGVLSVLPTSAQTISLSAYATLSGSNFTGPVSAPSLSATSISALNFETSSVKISQTDNLLKIIEKTGYYQDSGISFGLGDDNKIYTKDGQMYLGGLNSYCSFDGSNFYITSGNLIVGDPGVATNLGQKSLINNQQLQQNYRAIFNSSAFILDKFKSKTLSTDSNGQLVGYDIGGVSYDTGDVPKALKTKLKAGTGCVLTTANDGSNGIVTSINFKGNSWRYLKNISDASYTILDTDDVLINLNTNSIFVLPNPSSLYEGRVVQVRGGLLGSTVTVQSLGPLVGTPSVVITNYDKRDFLCYFNSVQWQWVITN